MTDLVKYDAACRALAEAVAVDEVADIRNKAEALRHYARQAGDRGLEVQAAQIRFRAERKMGEMLIAAKDAGQLREGRPKNRSDKEQFSEIDGGTLAAAEAAFDDYRAASPFRVTLEQAGIDRKLSSRAQRVAAMDVAEFEHALARHAEEMRAGQGRVAMDLLKVGAEEKGRVHRRNLAQVLSDKSVDLPTGRKYPCVYIDPPWHRNAGIGDRSYENHYSTMSWSEICALPVADLLLPDAWIFIWIPRAHLLALHEIELEVTIAETGEVVPAKVEMPLAWAVAKAFGADSYSTCYVWTKTDADNPDAKGAGLLVRDQDELLLQFKRGQGLPKPAGDEKFGSNHRERPREHSRKPEFYRQMIATMTGGLPVLEMFARVDAEHPLPAGWDAWGNQAGAPALSLPITPEEASGTAREAPSTLCEREPGEPLVGAAGPDVGTQSAPPHAFDAALVDAKRERRIWPAGHVVSMTNPTIDGAWRSVGTCSCGEVFSFPWGEHAPMDAAIEAHWQQFDAQPDKVDGRGNTIEIEQSSFAAVPSGGETVTAAAEATSDRAGAAAVVTDSEPAFPPTEFADLSLFEVHGADERIPAARVAEIAPEYVRRGLVHSWCGSWRLSPAGVIRLQVLERERAARVKSCMAHLSADDFCEWEGLAMVAGGEIVRGEAVRDLVGRDLAHVTTTRVFLTKAGRARLAELEAIVDQAAGVAPVTLTPAPTAPKQLDLLQGA